ncbi:hypothetical protein PR048_016495 [Dryococelus australis]|uniref:Uncharacterized protein n=1 Tax=Dryococelus australis TaxID=614101 RepID=A0ABQ9HJV6_9NEOP|nr:hypothetical protein PR048_016495 [Dryococelus australis]
MVDFIGLEFPTPLCQLPHLQLKNPVVSMNLHAHVTWLTCAEILAEQSRYCNDHAHIGDNIQAPEKNGNPTVLKYQSYYKIDKVPIVVYVDFEAMLGIGSLVNEIYRQFVSMHPQTKGKCDDYAVTNNSYNCSGPFNKENKKVHDHKYFTGAFIVVIPNKTKLVTCKGVFPYSNDTSLGTQLEPQFPEKAGFHN